MEEAAGPGALSRREPLAGMAEGELVAACARGEPEAFKELLARYRRSALTLAYHMLGSVEDAEDVAQEAFVRVFQAMPKFRREAAFSTWLYRIVTNLCLGRKRRQRPAVELESLREPSGYDSPSQRAAEGLVARQVLASLRPEQRAVLLLREQEGLSYRDIAVAVGVPIGTIRSRLSKARASFRRRWTELLEGRSEP